MSQSRSKPFHSAVTATQVAEGTPFPFSGLIQQANHHAKLGRILSEALGPDLSPYCQVSCQRGGELILLAPSAAWATRIRMQSGILLDHLRRAGHRDIQRILVRLAPAVSQRTPERRQRILSDNARIALKRFADHIENKELRAIAQRLSTRKRGTS